MGSLPIEMLRMNLYSLGPML